MENRFGYSPQPHESTRHETMNLAPHHSHYHERYSPRNDDMNCFPSYNLVPHYAENKHNVYQYDKTSCYRPIEPYWYHDSQPEQSHHCVSAPYSNTGMVSPDIYGAHNYFNHTHDCRSHLDPNERILPRSLSYACFNSNFQERQYRNSPTSVYEVDSDYYNAMYPTQYKVRHPYPSSPSYQPRHYHYDVRIPQDSDQCDEEVELINRTQFSHQAPCTPIQTYPMPHNNKRKYADQSSDDYIIYADRPLSPASDITASPTPSFDEEEMSHFTSVSPLFGKSKEEFFFDVPLLPNLTIDPSPVPKDQHHVGTYRVPRIERSSNRVKIGQAFDWEKSDWKPVRAVSPLQKPSIQEGSAFKRGRYAKCLRRVSGKKSNVSDLGAVTINISTSEEC